MNERLLSQPPAEPRGVLVLGIGGPHAALSSLPAVFPVQTLHRELGQGGGLPGGRLVRSPLGGLGDAFLPAGHSVPQPPSRGP